MSRVGKHPVALPQGVTVELKNQTLSVKGKLGALTCAVPDDVTLTVEAASVTVAPKAKTTKGRTLWGTLRQNIQNMVQGVSAGFTRTLEIEGVGYRAAMQGNDLVLQLGFSHEVRYPVPQGISIKAEKPTLLHISGFDKQHVGQVASEIRGMKPPEPYKGKGIRYKGEWILRKEGKKK